MSFTYNKDTELVSYNFSCGEDTCYSCFKVPLLIVEKIDATLLNGEMRKDTDLFNTLREAFHKSMYKKYKKVFVKRDANKHIIEAVYNAYENQSRVMVQLKDGWEFYPSDEDESRAIYSTDGKNHIGRIGKSTGEKPILLFIENGASGGDEVSYNGIESIQEID